MTRLSPAREAEIRAMDVNAQGWAVTREVLAELDAVRRERDEASEAVKRVIREDGVVVSRQRDERDEAVKVAATMRDALEDCLPFLGGLRAVAASRKAAAALAAVPSSMDGPT